VYAAFPSPDDRVPDQDTGTVQMKMYRMAEYLVDFVLMPQLSASKSE